MLNIINKTKFLSNSRALLGKTIFGSEVPYEFLEDVINLFSKQSSIEKNEDVIDFLIKLSQCKRFELNLIFLTKEKKASLKTLLQDLILKDTKHSQQLSSEYKMILNA